MRKRTLGKTELSVSELGLGTWGLSGDAYGAVPEAEQARLIERARMLGITWFETADCYGAGKMEQRLGETLDEESLVVTKWGTDRSGSVARKRFDEAYLREACDRSAARLKRTVQVALLHNPSAATLQAGEATGTLDALKSEGKLRFWGVSAGDETVARAAIDAGAELLSLAYNVFRQKPLNGVAEALKEREVGVLIHSVLNYGQLCGMWSAFRQFRPPDHRAERWTAEELKRRVRHLDALRPMIGGEVMTLRSAALRFALNQELVGGVILGPRNSVQLDQLVREAGKGPPYLSEGKLAALQNRLSDLEVEP